MPAPFTLVDSVETPEGLLELRRRNDDFMVTIAGRVLMTSHLHRTEDAVATLSLARRRDNPRPRVLLGGLGLGFTLRATLDALPRKSRVTVAELNPRIVDWCKGPLAPHIGQALDDPRVRVEVCDFAELARTERGLDAIIIDLYEGPGPLPKGKVDRLYGDAANDAAYAALEEGGVYAVWSEEPYPPFERSLARAGFKVERVRAGRGGPRHAVYLALRKASKKRRG